MAEQTTATSHTATGIIRLQELVQLTGLSRATIYRLELANNFPRRRILGKNSVGWLRSEVIDWTQKLPAQTLGGGSYEV